MCLRLPALQVPKVRYTNSSQTWLRKMQAASMRVNTGHVSGQGPLEQQLSATKQGGTLMSSSCALTREQSDDLKSSGSLANGCLWS